MKTFRQFNNNQINLELAVIEMVAIMDMSLQESHDLVEGKYLLNEGSLGDLLTKAGLHLGKSKGLINHLQAAGKGLYKIFVAAIRGDKEELKAVIKTIKKEDVLDFVLKLDQATLHLITGPLHFIEAVTGWHLWAAIHATHSKIKDVAAKVKDAINAVKDGVIKVLDSTKAQLHLKSLARLETDIGSVA